MASDTQAANGAADAADAPGLPQLDLTTFGNQIFWLAVALVAIYFILSRIALPRIAAVLAERQDTISNDLAAAEDLKSRADEAEKAYQKALAEAKAEAQRIAAETKAAMKDELARANAEADARIAEKTAEGEKKIAEIRDSAAEAVREVAKDVTSELVTAMGQKADGRSVNAAVNAQLKE